MNEITVEQAVKSGRPYVYLLCYPDGRPFYVGKGTRKRIFNHLREAENTEKNDLRLEVIRAIQQAEQKVLFKIDSLHLDNISALLREQVLFFEYGLKKDNTGILTNKSFGKIGSRVKNRPSVICVTVRFENYIVKMVKALAEAEKRSFNQQVNYMLSPQYKPEEPPHEKKEKQ